MSSPQVPCNPSPGTVSSIELMEEISELWKELGEGLGEQCFGIGNSPCKGPEASLCLVYWRKSKGAAVVGDEQGKQRSHISEGSVGPLRALALI